MVEAQSVQIGDVRLPLKYRATEKPTVTKAVTVSTPLHQWRWITHVVGNGCASQVCIAA